MSDAKVGRAPIWRLSNSSLYCLGLRDSSCDRAAQQTDTVILLHRRDGSGGAVAPLGTVHSQAFCPAMRTPMRLMIE